MMRYLRHNITLTYLNSKNITIWDHNNNPYCLNILLYSQKIVIPYPIIYLGLFGMFILFLIILDKYTPNKKKIN